MSTHSDRQAAQLQRIAEQDIGAAQTDQDPKNKELICSPWMGLHYRTEEGQSLDSAACRLLAPS